jgi:hypothetical protein
MDCVRSTAEAAPRCLSVAGIPARQPSGFDEPDVETWGFFAFTLDDMKLAKANEIVRADSAVCTGATVERRTAWDTLPSSRCATDGSSGAQPVVCTGARSPAESSSGRVSADVLAAQVRCGVAG